MLSSTIKITFPLLANFYNHDHHYNIYRINVVRIAGSILQKYEKFIEFTFIDQSEFVKKIEQSIYAKTLKTSMMYNILPSWQDKNFIKIYNTTTYKILTFLDIDSMVIDSSYVVENLLNNKIKPENIAETDLSIQYRKKYSDIIEHYNDRQEQKIEYRFSKLVKCNQCKRFSCTENTVQTRSLDEAATKKYTCVHCKIQVFGAI